MQPAEAYCTSSKKNVEDAVETSVARLKSVACANRGTGHMTTAEYLQVSHGNPFSNHDLEWRSNLLHQQAPTELIQNASRLYSLYYRAGNYSRPHTVTSHSSDSSNDVVALVLYAVISVLGTTVNIFQISSLIIQENLRHHGNVFLVNQALANLLVTTIGLPASCIAILSGNQKYSFICYWQWYIAMLCFFTSVINFFFIAIENVLRARRKRQLSSGSHAYTSCCGVKVSVALVFFVWVASINWILILMFFDKSHDVCKREYGLSIVFLSFLAPLSLTVLTFAFAIRSYKQQLNELERRQCLESREENLHRQLFKSNAVAYFMFLCFWMPFAIAVSLSTSEVTSGLTTGQLVATSRPASSSSVPVRTVSPRVDYVASSPNTVETLLIIAQIFSCLCGLVYAFTNGSFGQAFMYLTRYFCCKAHPEFSKSTFQEKPRGTVRVHIGMETRVGERSTRATKLMSAMIHDSPHRGRSGDHFL